jgi:hypothetical protein
MPTRKQRRREAKERRHEYETVWVDSEGNELEEPPEEALAERPRRDDRPKAKQQPQRGGRPTRVPQPPSWRRSIRRSAIWVVVLAVLIVWLQSRSKNPNYGSAVVIAGVYVLLFPVMTYWIDRMMYRRYQAKNPPRGSSTKS